MRKLYSNWPIGRWELWLNPTSYHLGFGWGISLGMVYIHINILCFAVILRLYEKP